MATCVNGLPTPSPGGWSVLKEGGFRGPIDALAGPGAVPAVVGLAATGLWQWSQRQWRLDPLSNEFQQELRRRGLVGVLP